MDIEEIIRRAEQEGKFSDVPGKGKPLNLANRGETDIVQHIVKQAGFVPGWVALGKEIDAGMEQWERMRSTFEAAYPSTVARIRAQTSEAAMPNDWRAVESAAGQLNSWWDRTVTELAKLGTELNRQIDEYNLVTPIAHQQRPRLKVRLVLEAFVDRCPRLALGEQDGARVLVPADSRARLEQALDACKTAAERERAARPPERLQAIANYVTAFRSRRR